MLNDKQKELRRTGIGGSDVAAIANKSNWASPLDIYRYKVGELEEEPQEDNIPLWLGQKLEPIYRERFELENKVKVIVPEETIRHPQYNWMLCNVDGIIPEMKAVLEIKHVSIHAVPLWKDEAPDYAFLQSAHYRIGLAHMGIERVIIWACLGGATFKQYVYEINEELEARIIKLESDFWFENVMKRKPPPPKTLEDAISLWPMGFDDKKKVATPDIRALVEEFAYYNDRLKLFSEQKEELQVRIAELMEDASTLVDENDNKLLSFKNQNTSRFDAKTFKEKHPDLYNQYYVTKENAMRVMRLIKGGKS